MKAGELQALLNLKSSTLHKYATDYAEYLSPSAVSGAGHHREYTEHDARVLKLILTMKGEKLSADDIAVTLNSLRSGDWQQLPPLDQNGGEIIPTRENLVAAGKRESALQREIEILREMLKDASSDRDDLVKRLAEAELLVKLYESGRLKPGS